MPPKITERQKAEKQKNIDVQTQINEAGRKRVEASLHAEEQVAKENFEKQFFSMSRTARQQLDITKRTRGRNSHARSYEFLHEHWDQVKKAFVSSCCGAEIFAWRTRFLPQYISAYFNCRKCEWDCEIKHKKGFKEVQFLQ